VDGIIVDNGERNHYATENQSRIVRSASSGTGAMPTPESGGISIAPWKLGDIVVRNCIVINTAPTDGAFSIWGHQGSNVIIENNLAMNNTGNGFSIHTSWHPRDGRDVPRLVLLTITAVACLTVGPAQAQECVNGIDCAGCYGRFQTGYNGPWDAQGDGLHEDHIP